MKSRRDFLKTAAAAGILGSAALPLRATLENSATITASTDDDRTYWVAVLDKIATPVLQNLARRELKVRMPVEAQPKAKREEFSHLEAFGRLLAGMAPWLGATGLDHAELKLQQKHLAWAQASLDAATDPKSADFLNFFDGGQALVDSAFLSQALLRAPQVLWEPLELRVKQQVIAALKSSRKVTTPDHNNWVMFAATVEAALLKFGEPALEDRLEVCIRKMLGWYKGDGVYGDGEEFHFDYYNSFVIHPMLLDVLESLQAHDSSYKPAHTTVRDRARRYAGIQERLIAPDGSFPSIGRSTTYRFGAFQLLAQMAWQRELPHDVKPAQVRCALTAVIRRMIEVSGTFDPDGWLRIGFCGHQPSLGETYISTGSLYLCAAGLLPLGLPPADEFWSGASARWTSQKLWSGEDLPADHAITDVKTVILPDLKR